MLGSLTSMSEEQLASLHAEVEREHLNRPSSGDVLKRSNAAGGEDGRDGRRGEGGSERQLVRHARKR